MQCFSYSFDEFYTESVCNYVRLDTERILIELGHHNHNSRNEEIQKFIFLFLHVNICCVY